MRKHCFFIILLIIVFFIFFPACKSKNTEDFPVEKNYKENFNSFDDQLLYNITAQDCDLGFLCFQFAGKTGNIKNYGEFKKNIHLGNSFIIEDQFQKKIIIQYLLNELSNLCSAAINEPTFFQFPLIYVNFGSFNGKNKDCNGNAKGVWQDIFINLLNNQIFVYIDEKFYKSGILHGSLFEIIKVMANHQENGGIVYQSEDSLVYFLKDQLSEKCCLLFSDKSGNTFLQSEFSNSYNKSTCRKINFSEGEVFFEVCESSGKGTNTNSKKVYIIKMNFKTNFPQIIFEKQISGFKGPSASDYWEMGFEYKDMDNDGIPEIVITENSIITYYKYIDGLEFCRVEYP